MLPVADHQRFTCRLNYASTDFHFIPWRVYFHLFYSSLIIMLALNLKVAQPSRMKRLL